MVLVLKSPLKKQLPSVKVFGVPAPYPLPLFCSGTWPARPDLAAPPSLQLPPWAVGLPLKHRCRFHCRRRRSPSRGLHRSSEDFGGKEWREDLPRKGEIPRTRHRASDPHCRRRTAAGRTMWARSRRLDFSWSTRPCRRRTRRRQDSLPSINEGHVG